MDTHHRTRIIPHSNNRNTTLSQEVGECHQEGEEGVLLLNNELHRWMIE